MADLTTTNKVALPAAEFIKGAKQFQCGDRDLYRDFELDRLHAILVALKEVQVFPVAILNLVAEYTVTPVGIFIFGATTNGRSWCTQAAFFDTRPTSRKLLQSSNRDGASPPTVENDTSSQVASYRAAALAKLDCADHHPQAVRIGDVVFLYCTMNDEDEFHCYHIPSDSWLERPLRSHSITRDRLRCHSLTRLSDTHLIICGGHAHRGTLSAACYLYNTTSDEWALTSPMSEPRTDAASVHLDGRVYVMGGTTTTIATRGDMSRRSISALCEAYDAKTLEWTQLSNLSAPRSGGTAVVVEGKILLCGGNVLLFDEYDPATNVWTCLRWMLLPKRLQAPFLYYDSQAKVLTVVARDYNEIYTWQFPFAHHEWILLRRSSLSTHCFCF